MNRLGTCPKPKPKPSKTVQNWDEFAMQPRNECFSMKIDKHLEYCRTVLKLVLGLYLQSFRTFRVVLL